jgi:ABC-type bacteriocin/lantibiotic exporter with double-glycine peptidase domain
MTFGSTIGVVLGDVKLYKRFRLSYGAAIAALFLAIVGFFFAFSFDELIQRFIPYSERNSLIRVAIGAAVMTVFPLITYNIITSKSRVQRKVNNQQQETPNS